MVLFLYFILDMKWTCWHFLAALKVATKRRWKNSQGWGKLSICTCEPVGTMQLKYTVYFCGCSWFSCLCRYAYPWWKEKIINSDLKRKDGLCPLTPEETALILRALDIDPNMQIYIAAGEIYGGERRMANLAKAYPKLVSRSKLKPSTWIGCWILIYFPWADRSLLPFLWTGQKRNALGTIRP